MGTAFDFTYTFKWRETRTQVINSGLLINGEYWDFGPITNRKLKKALRKYTLALGPFAVDDKAVGKLRIAIVRTKGNKV